MCVSFVLKVLFLLLLLLLLSFVPFLAVLCGMWDHSTPTRDQTLALEVQSLMDISLFFQQTVLGTFYGRMFRGNILEEERNLS